jgi:hypothetical protein
LPLQCQKEFEIVALKIFKMFLKFWLNSCGFINTCKWNKIFGFEENYTFNQF